jgi:hypothetical protein
MKPMTVLKRLSLLPPLINYVGYTFQLGLRGDKRGNLWLGYFLFSCHSKKRYKKRAYTEGGVWDEKERVVVSSVGSNYLFKVLTFDSDIEPIETLTNYLKSNGLLIQNLEQEAVETEFIEINNLQLN